VTGAVARWPVAGAGDRQEVPECCSRCLLSQVPKAEGPSAGAEVKETVVANGLKQADSDRLCGHGQTAEADLDGQGRAAEPGQIGREGPGGEGPGMACGAGLGQDAACGWPGACGADKGGRTGDWVGQGLRGADKMQRMQSAVYDKMQSAVDVEEAPRVLDQAKKELCKVGEGGWGAVGGLWEMFESDAGAEWVLVGLAGVCRMEDLALEVSTQHAPLKRQPLLPI
jgi:hypothetical protein